MGSVNIHEAKTHVSRLVEQDAHADAFDIAKAGKPMVKVVPVDAPEATTPQRLGFMQGRVRVPDDFDTLCKSEIEQLFAGNRPLI